MWKYSLFLLVVCSFIALHCSDKQNPYKDPENAVIAEHTLPNQDTLAVGTSYFCSVGVSLPTYIEEITIRKETPAGNTTIAQGKPDTSSWFTFVLPVSDTGRFSIEIVVWRNDGTRDTERKTFFGAVAMGSHFLIPNSFKPENQTLVINAAQPCSLSVILPHLIDSFIITDITQSRDTILTQGIIESKDVTFPLMLPNKGEYQIQVTVVAYNGIRDSLSFAIMGITAPPEVYPESTSYHVHVDDSVTVEFNAIDPDNDLTQWEIWFGNSQTVIRKNFDTNPVQDLRYSYSTAFTMFDTVLCYSRVFDIENNISEIAVCTVFVLDTISPTILLTSHQNGDTISTLLDTVIVNIHDNSGIQHVQFIDSVTHTSNDMYRVDDTTFLQAISAPSGGTYTFTIDAVDRAGNSKTTLYSLYFNPSTSAPFSVAIPDQQTKEDTKFPKIALDNHVTFNASGLSADDIKWTITTKTGSHLQVAYDPTQRTVVITPEHNWYGSESVTFFATVYDTIPAVDYATFVVANVNDSPSITMPGVYCKKANAQFDTLLLDTCANDPDQDWLQWTFTAGDYFEVKYISTFIYLKDNTGIARPIKRRTNRVIIVEKADAAIPLPPDWKGTDTLGFSVSDGVYTAKKNILFRKADNCLFIPIIF